ncbi:YniB family protein [Pantoea sp. 1.19]|uniref:YniB family protein n=1 Tax=Pantoea sp. 1.19 TaxID=1925589 RepID=UPI0009491FE6|nr:YniB family protein [Pantoea sp. 1.19]
MTYQQASRIAVVKRLAGWGLFLIALLSTTVSLLGFLYQRSQHPLQGLDAVLLDFIRVMVEMIRFNTPFLAPLWQHSPVPDFRTAANVGFWLVYFLIFVGLALTASGARMSRQARHVREGIEDQLILERAKGSEGRSRDELEAKIVLPRHTILLQFFPLYILPLLIAAVGYFILKLVGFLP